VRGRTVIDMSRNVVTGCALVAGLLTMSGCASAAQGAEQSVPLPIGHVSTVESQVRFDGLGSSHYLDTVRGLLSGIPHEEQSDADLIQGGKDLCAEIDRGATWETFSRQIDEVGGDRALYRAVIRAAVLSFCIEDSGILP
jgi:hypothetical protein